MTESNSELYRQMPLERPPQESKQPEVSPSLPLPQPPLDDAQRELEHFWNQGILPRKTKLNLPPLESQGRPTNLPEPGEAFAEYMRRGHDPVVNRNRDIRSPHKKRRAGR